MGLKNQVWERSFSKKLLYWPCLNIEPSLQPSFADHRFGWQYALDALAPLHNPNGVLLDSFVERTFCWHEESESRSGMIPYEEEWVGFIHNPPGIPLWNDISSSPQRILERDSFVESLETCKGLFVLSDYLRDWLVGRVDVPVCSVRHPTGRPVATFNPDRFRSNPKPMLVQVGWWLRRCLSIYRIAILCVRNLRFQEMLRREMLAVSVTREELNGVAEIEYMSNEEYDQLLSKNLVFCDLIDASANNTIIECIARNTPILVNRLPAVEEYLGRDYPLYFDSLDEAAKRIEDLGAVMAAFEYLKGMDKSWLSGEAFMESVANSRIYEELVGQTEIPQYTGPDLRVMRNANCVGEVRDDRGVAFRLFLAIRRDASGALRIDAATVDMSANCESDAYGRILTALIQGCRVCSVRGLDLSIYFQQLGSSEAPDAVLAAKALHAALAQV